MEKDARGRCRFSSTRVGDALVTLLLVLVLLVGIAASATSARAITPASGPRDLLLDPGTGRLYSYLYLDNRIFVMDVTSGQLVQVIADVGIRGDPYHPVGISALALDAQIGRLFAINSAGQGPEGDDWTLFVIDATQGTILQQVSFGPSSSLLYSTLLADETHGKLYLVVDESTTVYDTATLAEVTTLPGGTRALLDGEGSRLYLASDEGLAIVNTADDAVLTELPLPESAWGMALDGVRGRLYVALESGIHVLDTTAQAWLEPLTEEPPLGVALAVDPADGEVYNVGPGGGGDQPATYHVIVLSPETGAQKTSIDFPEPEGCGGNPTLTVSRLVADPAGGRIYGSGNAMWRCDSADLAFVLDTEAEAFLEWLPRSALPDTGGRPPGGGWLVGAGAGLLLCGMLLYRWRGRRGKS